MRRHLNPIFINNILIFFSFFKIHFLILNSRWINLPQSSHCPSSRKICCWPAKLKEPQSSWPTLVQPLKFRANSKLGSVSFRYGPSSLFKAFLVLDFQVFCFYNNFRPSAVAISKGINKTKPKTNKQPQFHWLQLALLLSVVFELLIQIGQSESQTSHTGSPQQPMELGRGQRRKESVHIYGYVT